jgi:hypothetical protein
MRVLVIILAVAAAPVAAAILWMRAQPEPLPATSLQPHGIVWADRVFTQPAELRRWLRARGERYKVWAKHHPLQAATLEHRRLPSARTAAREPRAASGGGPSGIDGGILALILGVAGVSVLTFQLRRRVRVGLPNVRLPAVAVDVAPLANGVRRNVGRLGRVPDVIRAARVRTGASRQHLDLPRPYAHSRGNGSMPRPVEHRPVIRVSRPEEPPVDRATALVDLPLVEEPRRAEEPRPVEEPRGPAAPQNGSGVDVRQEVSPVEPAAPAGTTRVDEIVEPPKLSNRDPLPKEGWERCAVACWRGYVNAQFYAHLSGEEAAIAISSPFEWWAWQQGPRNVQAAEAALDELHGLLEVAGWEAVGRGDAWYELRFQREPRISW